MIKKKIAYLGVIGCIGGSVLTSGTTVFATGSSRDVPVSFNNKDSIPDPTNPENPSYVVSVPSAIIFSTQNQEIDTTVSITNPDGTQYEGASQALISVNSKNDFQLKNTTDSINYRLVTIINGDGNLITNTNNEIGTLSQEVAAIQSSARLDGIAVEKGLYTDTLVYTVTAN